MVATPDQHGPDGRAPLRIYNTMTRRIEDFATIEPGKVRMYVCGVTPYASAHIGHGMSAIVFDVIRRYLEHRGYAVRHAQNFTDVDDRIIERANHAGVDPLAFVDRLIAEWLRETDALGILRATVYPRVTQEIGPIVEFVAGLIERGHAYVVDGDVYFRVRSFLGYGKLSHRSIDDLLAGARVEVDERKDDPLDFALWKSTKPGESAWESPWGLGRPGWHIECSAMSATYLDGEMDIHGGGADLIFPHHENEIAQSEAYLGREPFARYWVHNGLLQLGGEKMSKSIGNLVPIPELVNRGLGPAFRLMVLQSHYRAPLTYTEESLQAAESGLDRLRAAALTERFAETATDQDGSGEFDLESTRQASRDRFHTAMNDDFNTPVAVAALFDLGRAINRSRTHGIDADQVETARASLVELAGVLGLDLSAPMRGVGDATPFIDLLVQVRQELREAKHWALSDRVRDGLRDLGVAVEDGATGSTWKRRSPT